MDRSRSGRSRLRPLRRRRRGRRVPVVAPHQISDQISAASADQIGEWREGMRVSDWSTGFSGDKRRPTAQSEFAKAHDARSGRGKQDRAPGRCDGRRCKRKPARSLTEHRVQPSTMGRLRAPLFYARRNSRDRLAELGLGDRAHVGSGHFAEDRVGQHRGQLVGRAIVVVLVPHTTRVGMVKALQPVHERVGETLEQQAPPRRDRSSGSS